MAVYQVRLVNPAIALTHITVPDDEYILDVEAAGIQLPAGCRQGLFCLCSKTGEW